MKKTLVLIAILVIVALTVFGCTRGSNQYPTGYAGYGGAQPQNQPQPYIGGGCGVAGPDVGGLLEDVSVPTVAAA